MGSETPQVVERYGRTLDAKTTRNIVLAVVRDSKPRQVDHGSSTAIMWYSPNSKAMVRLYILNGKDNKGESSLCFCNGMQCLRCSTHLIQEVLSMTSIK